MRFALQNTLSYNTKHTAIPHTKTHDIRFTVNIYSKNDGRSNKMRSSRALDMGWAFAEQITAKKNFIVQITNCKNMAANVQFNRRGHK